MEWQKVLEILTHQLKPVLKKKVKREDELMSILWNDQNIKKLVYLWLEDHYDRKECKSVSKAQIFKKMGNKEFQEKNYIKSIELYTKCALYAPVNSCELAVAIANRSASLFYLNRYHDCIKDIELATNLNYPRQLQYKLYLRAAQCYLKLGEQQLAKETLSKIQKMIHDSDYLAPSMKAIDKIYNQELGRHVIANKSIKKGDILFLEKPVSFVLLSHDIYNLCPHCNCSNTDIPVPCTTCLNTFYCNEHCLTKAWSLYHCWECPGNQMELWKEIGIGHLALKVLLTCSTMTDEIKFNEIQNLVTNFDKLSMDDLTVYGITAVMLTIYLLKYTNFFQSSNLEDCLKKKFPNNSLNTSFNILTTNDEQLYVSSLLLRYILQLIANGHAITKSNTLLSKNDSSMKQQDIVATGIYPSASMMNHSCDPNIINIFVGQYLIVRASRDIGESEEIFNCYGPHYRHMTTEDRQKILKGQYCFTCKCKACTLPKLQYFIERFNAVKCLKCNGPVCNIKDSIYCLDCGDKSQIYSPSKIIQAKEIFEAAQVSVDLGKMKEALNKLKKCLHIRRTVLYKYNEDITDTLILMGEIYKTMGQWIDSITCFENTLATMREKFGSSSIELLNQLNDLTDICLIYLEKKLNTNTDTYKKILKKTQNYLNQLEEIANFNYGSWNKVYEDIKQKQMKIDYYNT
ncbi:SET and MYND domain-containing protein 4-like isoform X2 [Bombus pyrosoma]|uniref:SET and MYND domain-containing protein 4-like isoform X2 n=1 Tax=Bombus pyrosoma TaxID=396416 RepID=UPI001CB9059B|nr:SET and MYND domain-containing protein 4-like isoform X2 [Bombus pyrosoma]